MHAVRNALYRLLSLSALLLLGACDRPFVAEKPPEIEIVAPGFSTILTTPTVPLRVAATSFRSIDSVWVNDLLLQYDPSAEVWTGEVRLQEGLNTLLLTATDRAGLTRVDTSYAVYLPHMFTTAAPALPEPRGGHAASLLRNGDLLITGGAARAGGPAQPTAFLLPSTGTAFQTLSQPMQQARTGHTATLLPDGRVLIAGGSTTDEVQTVQELVETAEIYDPATGQFTRVPIVGAPIRRTLHTAAVRNTPEGPVLSLYGGRGDVDYGDPPRLGVRRDLRRFLLRNDSLIAQLPAPIGVSLPEAIAGHTQTLLNPFEEEALHRYLLAGSYFLDEATHEPLNVVLDYGRPQGLTMEPAPAFFVPRTRHAAALLQPGLALFFGGHQATRRSTLNVSELYAAEAGAFFRFPDGTMPIKRYGHTATKTEPFRILLVGGFSSDGNGLTVSEFFRPAKF